MKFYSLDIDETLKKLNSNKDGLSNEEVQKRLKKDGKNKIIESKKESNFSKFLNEFKDLMIIILILSAIVSFILSILNNESFTDSLIILAIVILNAILGFIQELKADKAIESLKKMQITTIKVKENASRGSAFFKTLPLASMHRLHTIITGKSQSFPPINGIIIAVRIYNSFV